MKTGLSLTALATEIERRRKAKEDFVAPASKLEMAVGRDITTKGKLSQESIVLKLLDAKKTRTLPINKIAHEQFADYAGIPMPYYRRMLEAAPELLAQNVNRWLTDKANVKDRRMVRTLDGAVRSLLSPAYRPLENEDLAEAVLPVLLDRDLLIMSCQVTESRLYIKAVDKKLERDVPTGRKMGDGSNVIFDTVCPQITISNSEVGRGSLMIESGIFTKACTNMALFGGAPMRKYHTGARAELSDEVFALLTDKTRRLTDAAIWSQTRDLVAAAFDEAKIQSLVDKLVEAADDRLPKKVDVVEVIERVGKRFGLADEERKGVLAALIQDGNLSRYGVHSAITRFSSDVDDYDRATELERIGGRVIELPKGEWAQMAQAA